VELSEQARLLTRGLVIGRFKGAGMEKRRRTG
jgi:hypothetical protein